MEAGRETNAAVVHAIGWEPRDIAGATLLLERKPVLGRLWNATEFRPSTNCEHAIIALQATGEDWNIESHTHGGRVTYAVRMGWTYTVSGGDLAIACCEAIRAWHASKPNPPAG